jgi:protein tyrosine phosphatase (PTP) superfamily phosphohydrolase (DUF442 family)
MGNGGAATGTRWTSRRLWPWLVLALTVVPAVWHVVDFDEDVDPEFPRVVRLTFSRVPASAYRLAEPGDTLDRSMIYLSAASVVVAAAGLVVNRGRALWPIALAVGFAALWYSGAPGPTVDGWHGLGWRTIFDPNAPRDVRAALLCGALVLMSIVAVTLNARRHELRGYWDRTRVNQTRSLWIAALVLCVARQVEIPGIEPQGYWPRWAMIWALFAFNLGIVIELAPAVRSKGRLLRAIPLAAAAWLAMVVAAVWLSWYHRPLARLKVVVPDRIYISAMPTWRGLEPAQARHGFRTIINLFPEDTPQGSPLLADELKFAREHDIKYVGSPSDPSEAASSAFLDQTLALAQDRAAWPILVHCHGCMDRSPAWMGIYRFVVEGRPLLEIMQEIERHRGYRPKASVTLLYNRVLPLRAPARYWADPTAAILRRCAEGTADPMIASEAGSSSTMNLGAKARVTTNTR